MTPSARRTIGLTIVAAAAVACGMCAVGARNALQGVGASGSAGIGAVSVGISEPLIEVLIIGLPLLWVYSNSRPTRLRTVQRRIHIGVAVVAVALIAVMVRSDDPFVILSAGNVLFPLIGFYLISILALRVGWPTDPPYPPA